MATSDIVIIVDDDEAVRNSTAQLLERTGHRVVTFASGDEFLAVELPSGAGCILLDLRMPGRDGLEVMRLLRERRSPVPVIVLTGHGDIALAVEAMKLGAIDFLEKPYQPERLIDAIAGAFARAADAAQSSSASREAKDKIDALSARQRDVLKGILRGKQSKIIAHELDLSTRTVEAYRAQLLAKLGVRGTAEAVRIALAAGLDDS